MTDTVETLRADLDALRQEFDIFKNYAKPTIDGHQQLPQALLDANNRLDGRGAIVLPPPPPSQ